MRTRDFCHPIVRLSGIVDGQETLPSEVRQPSRGRVRTCHNVLQVSKTRQESQLLVELIAKHAKNFEESMPFELEF